MMPDRFPELLHQACQAGRLGLLVLEDEQIVYDNPFARSLLGAERDHPLKGRLADINPELAETVANVRPETTPAFPQNLSGPVPRDCPDYPIHRCRPVEVAIASGRSEPVLIETTVFTRENDDRYRIVFLKLRYRSYGTHHPLRREFLESFLIEQLGKVHDISCFASTLDGYVEVLRSRLGEPGIFEALRNIADGLKKETKDILTAATMFHKTPGPCHRPRFAGAAPETRRTAAIRRREARQGR